jgi:hypothetical protein
MKVTCGKKIFDVYSQKEADELKIKYCKNWRDAEKGDWVLTSDKKVIEVLSTHNTGTSNNKKRVKVLNTGYGYYPVYKKSIFAVPQKKYKASDKRFNYKYEISPTEKQLSFTRKLIDYGKRCDNGMFDNDSIIKAYMSVYDQNNPTSALMRGSKILKKKSVRQFMSKAMKQALVDRSMDDKWVASKLEGLSGDDTPHATRLNAVNRVSDLLGHNDKEERKTELSAHIQLSSGDLDKLGSKRDILSKLMSVDDEILDAVYYEIQEKLQLSDGKSTKSKSS